MCDALTFMCVSCPRFTRYRLCFVEYAIFDIEFKSKRKWGSKTEIKFVIISRAHCPRASCTFKKWIKQKLQRFVEYISVAIIIFGASTSQTNSVNSDYVMIVDYYYEAFFKFALLLNEFAHCVYYLWFQTILTEQRTMIIIITFRENLVCYLCRLKMSKVINYWHCISCSCN